MNRMRNRHTFRKGEAHHFAKLTAAQVRAIDSALRLGFSNLQLAGEYGVSPPAISMIATGRTWGHITGRRNQGWANEGKRPA